MASPSAVEVGLITEFRKRFKSGELNEDQQRDVFFIRWIRARNLDLNKAEEMLRKSLKWREENGIDIISTWEPTQELQALIRFGIAGHDADNSTILYMDIGATEFIQIVRNGQQEDALKNIDKFFEQLLEQQKGKKQRDGTLVTQFVVIANMEGFSFRNLTNIGVVDLILRIAKSFEANRPETLKKLNVVNAGRTFTLLFALIKPILSPSTQSKISTYNNESKWKRALLENIAVEVLPPVLGGTNTDFAFQGGVQVSDGGDTKVVEEADSEFLTVALGPADKTTLAFEATDKNDTLTWALKTNKKGISLTVSSNGKTYLDDVKIDSHLKVNEGSIPVDALGDYVFTFNNTANSEAQELEYRVEFKSGGK